MQLQLGLYWQQLPEDKEKGMANVFIPIYYQKSIDRVIVKEVCAGLEEEGVPFRIKEIEDQASAPLTGPLGVIIILGVEVLTIHHEKIENGVAYLNEPMKNPRLIGKNGARLVKGLPLILTKRRDREWKG